MKRYYLGELEELILLTIADGRGFSREFLADSNNFVVNEEAVRQMGIEDPVGKEVTIWSYKKERS